MSKQQIKSKRGFTIIEVVLVLAIGGLIMLMVFLALPALQRNQRDTQRQNDISRFITALVQYQTNNRGRLPDPGDVGTLDIDPDTESAVDASSQSDLTDGGWVDFYNHYLRVNGTDTFLDPSGGLPYILDISECSASAAGVDCAILDSGGTGKITDDFDNISFEDQLESTDNTGYYLSVLLGATCNNDRAVGSQGGRTVAVLYKKEGAGNICNNN